MKGSYNTIRQACRAAWLTSVSFVGKSVNLQFKNDPIYMVGYLLMGGYKIISKNRLRPHWLDPTTLKLAAGGGRVSCIMHMESMD